ncbi:hypothetical protein SAMN05216344_10815 [Polaromonas sp. OV174]|uniref:hypothetical protein n=1 Tax=Polaromonas sp. OV174 TaxID=1855300 RepID=UPI0008E9D475|nr:hypothetical protein [Polaromonas sp. OV174]SFC05403.1 hypothetical protein SAMN05216344_10815 [Polaromonas sp. OV174]
MPGTVAADGRMMLSYSIEQLSARDALLMKSLVRLLDHRTHQQWSCQSGPADLKVVGDDPAQQTAPATNHGEGIPVLRLDHTQQPHEHFLKMPLHANELELMLNKLGKLILQAGAPSPAPSSTSHSNDAEYRLLRWPPAALLATPARIKLATLMTGQPLSLSALQHRSSQARQDCADFFQALLRAGLLQAVAQASLNRPLASPPSNSQNHAERPRPALGLLARIRSRLGLQSPGPT